MAGNSFYLTAPPGAGATSFYATPTNVRGTGKDVIWDGDWTKALASGAPLVTRPFESEGDILSKLIRQPVQQDLRYRQPLAQGTAYNYPDAPTFTRLHNTAILLGETEPRDLGGYLGEWERTYATIPPTRETPESYNYGFQYYSVAGNTTVESSGDSVTNYILDAIETLSLPVASKVKREYFLFKDLAKYPILRAPKIVLLDKVAYKIGDGQYGPSTTLKVFISTDPEIIAESSVYEYWNFPIVCRKTRYIPSPTNAFWGSAVTIPTLASS